MVVLVFLPYVGEERVFWGEIYFPLLVWQELPLLEAHVTSNSFILVLTEMGS